MTHEDARVAWEYAKTFIRTADAEGTASAYVRELDRYFGELTERPGPPSCDGDNPKPKGNTMSVTREDALEDARKLQEAVAFTIDARREYAGVILAYLNHPPEDPDAEVWAEIEGLVTQLDNNSNENISHLLFTEGNGLWGLETSCTGIDDSSFKHDGPALNTLSEIRTRLSELANTESTIETERAARKEAEGKVEELEKQLKISQDSRAVDEEVKADMAKDLMDSTRRLADLEITNEENTKLRDRIAELEVQAEETPGREWKRYVCTSSRGIYGVRKQGDDYVVMVNGARSQIPSLWHSYASKGESQDDLDAYAEEHGWEKVKP